MIIFFPALTVLLPAPLVPPAAPTSFGILITRWYLSGSPGLRMSTVPAAVRPVALVETAAKMELVMSLQCALHPDFPEGVRALLVDKDGAPQWREPQRR